MRRLSLLALFWLFNPPTSVPTLGSSPIIPASLGTWQAGRVWAVDRATHHLHIDYSPVNPELSDNSLMPHGQRVEFTNGYDKAANVAYWQVFWQVPHPPDACQYPFFRYRYVESQGSRKPEQLPVDMEFTMEITSQGVESFFAVGASKTGRVYALRCGGNDEWVPQFYVSKDRQQMWSFVGVEEYQKYYGLQEYHRVAEYKRRP